GEPRSPARFFSMIALVGGLEPPTLSGVNDADLSKVVERSCRKGADRRMRGSRVQPPGRRLIMAASKAYPYATYLDIKFNPLTLIDTDALAKTVTDQWYNQTLCRVNDSVVRLGVMEGEYHWHKHDNDDEFFFVLSGRFIIDLESRSVELLPNQGFVVP